MTILKDKLTAALNVKSNDITTFIWKGPKEEVNGQKVQSEIRLVDATDDQLKEFYAHCKSMLYSKDPVDLGRYLLLDKISEDREKCNAELYMRYLEGSYLPDERRPAYPRFKFLEDMNKYLSRNSTIIPSNKWAETPISTITEGMPIEFQHLSIDMVLDAGMDQLGEITKKPITLRFITEMGVWFDPSEMKDLLEKDEETGKVKNRLDVVRERLNLKSFVRLKIDPKGLSYNEFRAMVGLKRKKISRLSTDQLLVLRNKVLFRLENEIAAHVQSWVDRIRQLEMVANSRGWSFEDSSTGAN